MIDEALRSIEQLRRTLVKRKSQAQVRTNEERALIKATCLAWFNSQLPSLSLPSTDPIVAKIGASISAMLEGSERGTSRASYLASISDAKATLVALRSRLLIDRPQSASNNAGEAPPDFSPLITDPKMQVILRKRWLETMACIAGQADLAAAVMMGGLLEGLLLARVNQMTDKGPAFKAKASPKDKHGKTLKLNEWTLNNYIEVAHELGWITPTAKDVGVVVRDYRNFIHPAKELSLGITLTKEDTIMLWSVFVLLSKQIMRSV